MREIEIKLKVRDREKLEQALAEKGCVLSAPIRQRDVTYSFGEDLEAWKASKEGDVILRLRYEDDHVEFSLKQQRSTEMDNLEYETRIENAEAMHQALLVLGYVPQVETKKIRRKGKLGEYELCLDEVEELGTYVELEQLTGDDADPAVVQEELLRTLESLGLSRADQEIEGYDTQIFKLRQKDGGMPS